LELKRGHLLVVCADDVDWLSGNVVQQRKKQKLC